MKSRAHALVLEYIILECLLLTRILVLGHMWSGESLLIEERVSQYIHMDWGSA